MRRLKRQCQDSKRSSIFFSCIISLEKMSYYTFDHSCKFNHIDIILPKLVVSMVNTMTPKNWINRPKLGRTYRQTDE